MSWNLYNIGQLHYGLTLFLLQESLATHRVPIKSVKEVLKSCEATESFGVFFYSSPELPVVYHLQKVSRKIRLESESFQRKISGSNGTSEKVVLFFWTEYSKRKFAFHFFTALAVFDTSFRRSRSFFSNGTDWEEIFQSWVLPTFCPNRRLTGLPM